MKQNEIFYRKLVKDYSGIIDSIDRLSEIIFGVIMTLTFTGTISIAEGGIQEVKVTLIAALGCNTAWGIVDGLMLIMATLYERGRSLDIIRMLHKAKTNGEANQIILDNITPLIAEVMTDEQLNQLRSGLVKLPEPPKRPFLLLQDFLNALVVFLLVFLSTLPMALPLLFIKDPYLALRTSNAIGLLIMFVCGFIIGKRTGFNHWALGFLFALLGALLVFMTIALGG